MPESASYSDRIQEHIQRISLRTLSLLLDLKGIGRMLEHARYMSLNAKISSHHHNVRNSFFTSMVLELNRIVSDLNGLFGEVDRFSWNVSTRVAHCARSRTRIQLYSRAVRIARRDAQQPSKPAGAEAEQSAADHVRRASLSAGEFTAFVGERMGESAAEIATQFANMRDLVVKLSALVDDIVNVAVQRIHLIALSSMIESTSKEVMLTNLPNIAQEINLLAKEMASFGTRVNEEISLLHADIEHGLRTIHEDPEQSARRTA